MAARSVDDISIKLLHEKGPATDHGVNVLPSTVPGQEEGKTDRKHWFSFRTQPNVPGLQEPLDYRAANQAWQAVLAEVPRGGPGCAALHDLGRCGGPDVSTRRQWRPLPFSCPLSHTTQPPLGGHCRGSSAGRFHGRDQTSPGTVQQLPSAHVLKPGCTQHGDLSPGQASPPPAAALGPSPKAWMHTVGRPQLWAGLGSHRFGVPGPRTRNALATCCVQE
ncbi:uncharacterized protein [Gorilla gorilla gorilla]|uniref:uncharacterized protein n=1 Tax=Gorilla gorilla gorilla TaxID=9595 RepID=UPI0008F4EC7A|nr:uncharacterized protein LOC109027774 [Gorilla gorilla gorilla]